MIQQPSLLLLQMARKSLASLLFSLSLVCLLLIPPNAFGSYVRGVHVFLKKNPNYQAKKIIKLEKGEQVEILEQKGYWRKVKARGIEGWLTRMSLVGKKRNQKLTAYKPKKSTIKKRNIRTRVARAAVGVKGLRESQIKRIEAKYDVKAVKLMESFAVNEQEAIRFLTEYSE